MELEQAMTIQPGSALAESVESLKAALNSQTTLIYILIAIAVLSLIIAIAAMRRGKSGNGGEQVFEAVTPAPAATASVSNDGAIAAAITAAIACILSQEKDGHAKGDQSSGFIVRRIRRA